MSELRDYQQEMLERLHRAWSGTASPRQQACRSVMVQMPTGTGKTYLMAEVIRQRIHERAKGRTRTARRGG